MSLIANIAEMFNCAVLGPDSLLEGDVNAVEVKMAYGSEISLLIASLPAGYKSRPHVQDSERVMYLEEGELWVLAAGKAYHLYAGDFLCVPNMAVHWSWNRSEAAARVYAFNALPTVGATEVRETSSALLTPSEAMDLPANLPHITWLSDRYVREMEAEPPTSENGGLMIRDADLPDSVHLTSAVTGRLSSKFVYGRSSNLMLAKRAGGYHSPPHLHACDQMNYLIAGEVWIFLEDEAFHLRPGDFMRVPKMAAHWAWNPGREDCVLIEGHSPVLAVENKPYARRLAAENAPAPANVVDNLWLPETLANREAELMKKAQRT